LHAHQIPRPGWWQDEGEEEGRRGRGGKKGRREEGEEEDEGEEGEEEGEVGGEEDEGEKEGLFISDECGGRWARIAVFSEPGILQWSHVSAPIPENVV
jgi:hypothetical protein